MDHWASAHSFNFPSSISVTVDASRAMLENNETA